MAMDGQKKENPASAGFFLSTIKQTPRSSQPFADLTKR